MFCLVTEGTRVELAELVTLRNVRDLNHRTRHRSHTVSTKVFSILLKISSPNVRRRSVTASETAINVPLTVPWPRNMSLIVSVGMVMGLSTTTQRHRSGICESG